MTEELTPMVYENSRCSDPRFLKQVGDLRFAIVT